jgi:hypothetical protein
MNLYLLTHQDKFRGEWEDKSYAKVVAAPNEERARLLAASLDGDGHYITQDYYQTQEVTCDQIGIATAAVEEGVILTANPIM